MQCGSQKRGFTDLRCHCSDGINSELSPALFHTQQSHCSCPLTTQLVHQVILRKIQHTPPVMLCPYFNVSILQQMPMYVLKSAFHDMGASMFF